MATTFVIARRGDHDKLREKFCDLREKEYCEIRPWEPKGSEKYQWKYDPWDYLLILVNGTVVGGCILVDNTTQNTGGKRLSSRNLLDSEIELCRIINTAKLGLYELFSYYYRILQYCIENRIETAYADIRYKLYRKLRMMRFNCIERIDYEPETKHGVDRFIPVKFSIPTVEKFYKQLFAQEDQARFVV